MSPQSHSQHKQKDHQHDHNEHHRMMMRDFKTRFLWSLLITVPILILSPLIQQFFGFEQVVQFTGDMYVLFVLATAVFFYGGWPFLKGAVDELKKKNPGMMTLIGLAIVVAYVYSLLVTFGLEGKMFYWELATLVDIMLLGHYIEMKSVLGASKSLEQMAKLLPDKANLKQEDDTLKQVPVNELTAGDQVVVKPGEKVPVDGVVVKGESYVNQAVVTGESQPVKKEVDDEVIAGTINSDGALTVQVQKTGADAYISQVMDLVKQAQASKSHTQDIANKAAKWLTVIAITVGVITLLGWLIFSDQSFVFALERMVTVMVITCPHALGLAIPLVVAVSTSQSAQNGLLIRDRSAFERMRDIQAVIFDKTGTLTHGEFAVSEVVVASHISESELLSITASVENNSEHPVAKAIVKAAQNISQVENFKALPGRGVQAQVNNQLVQVMSPQYVIQQGFESAKQKLDQQFDESAQTIVYVLQENKLVGAIGLADKIRPESKQAIQQLKNRGIATYMLTGDSQQVAQSVAEQMQIDDYFAQVLPDQKADKVKQVQSQGMRVAMVGDGVNDAPALAQADIGIAIGAGTDVAVETADIILVRNNPLDVVKAIGYADKTYKKMIQNLIWATGYNIIAIPLAAGVLFGVGIVLSPAAGAVLMSLSTVVVAINAKILSFKQV